MGIDCSVNASKFLIQENISSVSYSPGEPQIIGLLEFLEGPHQCGMRHRRVGRNARLGLKFILGINIHMFLLGYGQIFAAQRARRRAAHRGAAELLKRSLKLDDARYGVRA
jgi:hypothetical protein